MALLVRTVVLCVCLAVALGASVFLTRDLRIKPQKYFYMDGCYVYDLKKVIPYGARIQAKKFCGLYCCSKEGLRAEVCDLNLLRPKLQNDSCYICEYMEKPYPDCCPVIKCDKKKGLLGISLN